MSRPITLASGQWADLPFETLCEKVSSFGYDGIEIACLGDHLDIRSAASAPAYVQAKKAVLARHGLKAWALSAHLAGQCVADPGTPAWTASRRTPSRGIPTPSGHGPSTR